jgi:predicted ribosome quality control (RQC) complex YloA/Tae2 family protein
MLPKNAIVTGYLALEYHTLLRDSILVRVEHHKESKIFRFLFKGDCKFHLRFSFAPPQILLIEGWAKRDDGFEIWQHAAGATVTAVGAPPGNRTISFELVKDDETTTPRPLGIVFELFGAKTNAFLIDSEGGIVHALRVVRDDRGLRPGVQYTPAAAMDPTPSEGTTDIASVGGTKYLLEFKGARHRVVTDPPTKIAVDQRTPLVDLFSSLHEQQAAQQELKQAQATALGVIKRDIKKTQGTIAQLKGDLAECDEAGKLKQRGDLLMANIDTSPEGDKVRVVDFYNDDKTATVPLIAGKSILESAAIYYKRAKRLQRMPAIINPRIRKLENVHEKLKERMAAVQKSEDIDQLRKLTSSFATTDKTAGKAVGRTVGESSPHYRTFSSSEGEKLLVGKSASGNDVVTFKVARTYDWWFHAQQATGSHVILVVNDKNRAPSKRSIIEAAQLAAYYSDLRKSHHVPVMYTERRHVRKAKGNIPGKAIFQQIKSIFVDPELPPTAHEEQVDI